jgi:hypothetical protein
MENNEEVIIALVASMAILVCYSAMLYSRLISITNGEQQRKKNEQGPRICLDKLWAAVGGFYVSR